MPAPFVSRPIRVEEGWIDYNGHLNMAYYSVIFDRGGDDALVAMGLGPDYARTRRHTTYTAESHVWFEREVHLGAEVTVTFHLLEADAKRLRAFQEIRHPEGWVAAACETLSLHVDMSGPRVAPFPPDIQARVDAMRDSHASLPVPDKAGRGVALKRRA